MQDAEHFFHSFQNYLPYVNILGIMMIFHPAYIVYRLPRISDFLFFKEKTCYFKSFALFLEKWGTVRKLYQR